MALLLFRGEERHDRLRTGTRAGAAAANAVRRHPAASEPRDAEAELRRRESRAPARGPRRRTGIRARSVRTGFSLATRRDRTVKRANASHRGSWPPPVDRRGRTARTRTAPEGFRCRTGLE